MYNVYDVELLFNSDAERLYGTNRLKLMVVARSHDWAIKQAKLSVLNDLLKYLIASSAQLK